MSKFVDSSIRIYTWELNKNMNEFTKQIGFKIQVQVQCNGQTNKQTNQRTNEAKKKMRSAILHTPSVNRLWFF